MCFSEERELASFIWEKFVQHVLPGCVSALAVLVQRRALAAVISVEFLFLLKTMSEN